MLTVVFALVTSAFSVRAADAVFPTGSRIGLVPPAGMVLSRTFVGFLDPISNVAIILAVMPAAAYAQLDKTMVPEALKKSGITIDQREPIELPIGKGFLLSGKQTGGNEQYRKWLLVVPASDLTALVTIQAPDQDQSFNDSAVRGVLASLSVRASVPDAERLSLLPFTVGDLAGFSIDDVLPGTALMLVDKDSAPGKDASHPARNTHILIAAMQGGPRESQDRDNFARVTFDQIGGINDVHIQDAEPLRINGQAGYQTLARAKEAQSGTDVMVVQWLRFGSGGFLQMIGIARADAWPEAFPRLRAVRDSIDPK